MIGGIKIQSVCRVLGHKRSKVKARLLATTWTSECLICGRRIIRVKRGHWMLLSDVHQLAAALYGPAFAQTWPVRQTFCFDELLQAIDTASSGIQAVRPGKRTGTFG